MKVGVIGIGTVGHALYKALQYYHKEVYCWDIEKKCDDWKKIIETDMVFICVPTNAKNGRLDMSAVDKTLENLDKSKYLGMIVIKSTLGLGYIDDKMDKCLSKIIIFPEWLRAAHALPDTLKPEMTVIGMEEPHEPALSMVLEACPWHSRQEAQIVWPEEAVMIKLTANALAATKITFANQIQLICEKYKIDPENVMKSIRKDPRCSPRYLEPGWPYAGHCLPKDMGELLNAVEANDMLDGVQRINEIFKRRQKSIKE